MMMLRTIIITSLACTINTRCIRTGKTERKLLMGESDPEQECGEYMQLTKENKYHMSKGCSELKKESNLSEMGIVDTMLVELVECMVFISTR